MIADAILAECLSRPDDDAPRLVWADAIGGERGELVGLQCGRDAATPAALVARNRRERELLAAHGPAWAGLDGLARRVRFRRGFVDAIEVTTETWLAHADRIVARAPFVTSLSLSHHHPKQTTPDDQAEARQRLERVIVHPAFAQIRALEICDRITDLEYTWGDVVVAVLAATGALAQLTALALPHRITDDGIRTLSEHAPVRMTRLWMRDGVLRPELTRALATAMPALVELDLRAALLDFDAMARGWPQLTSLRLRTVVAGTVVALAASALARQLERLVLDPSDRRDRLEPAQLVKLASFERLRALQLDGELCEDPAAFHAFGDLALPELRELRLGWTTAPTLEVLLARFGPQLELVDLRANRRVCYESSTCDVLVDEPRELELLHAGPPDRASWRVPSEIQMLGTPLDVDAWLVEETEPNPGRVWDLGMLGDRRIRIGRSGMGDVVLRHGSIARTHAVLDWRDGGHHVRDMKSTNGVVIDGEHIDDRRLRDGTRFKLGDVVLSYFVGLGAGARATACVRRLDVADPITGLLRATSPAAARVRLAELAELTARLGSISVDALIAVVAQRLRDAAAPDVTVTTPARGEFGIDPPEAAPALVAAVTAPVDVDGEPVPVRLTLA